MPPTIFGVSGTAGQSAPNGWQPDTSRLDVWLRAPSSKATVEDKRGCRLASFRSLCAAGARTRLWPVSRESMPKQFVPLVGPLTTFRQVLARISDPDLAIIITNAESRFVVAEQLREQGIEADIVVFSTLAIASALSWAHSRASVCASTAWSSGRFSWRISARSVRKFLRIQTVTEVFTQKILRRL